VNTSILPRSDNTYDLGSADYRWKDGYFSGFLDSNALKIDRLKILDTSYILRNVRWLHFDGVDDYVRVPPFLQDGDSFSIILFSRFGSVDRWRTMAGFYYDLNAISYRGDISPRIMFVTVTDYNNETHYEIASPYIKTQTNYFTAMSVDNVNKKMTAFLNDTKLDEITFQGSTIKLSNKDLNIYRVETEDRYLSGDVYFLAVYNRALSDAEISQIYNYVMSGEGEMITDGLVLWLDGDSIDIENGIWHDKSGNGNDGIIYGATYQSIFDELTASDIPWGSVNSSILPISDNVYDLGSSSNRWKDGYFSGTVYASTFSGNIDWSNITGKPTPYSYDISSSSYTVDAGAETTLLSKSGEGFVNILYQGDGSADLSIRVYVDGSLDDEFSCDEIRVGTYAFNSSIEVKLYNPGTSSVTGNCPTSNVRGWVR